MIMTETEMDEQLDAIEDLWAEAERAECEDMERREEIEEAYRKGRSDKYQEITSEHMLLTPNQVEEIRAGAIDECKEVLRKHWLNGTVAYHIIDEINGSLEKLKEGNK